MYELITFDMFSAVLDIEGSALPHIEAMLKKDPQECLAFFRIWRNRQWDYVLLSSCMQNGHLPYRDITWKTLQYAQKKTKMALTSSQQQELMAVWHRFKGWPEAASAVGRIRDKGYPVAALSNGDDDMLGDLQESSGIFFDHVFSAERAGRYKPHPGIYALPEAMTGIPKEKMLHVAGSLYDMMGAKAAGCFCAWVNRASEYTIDAQYRPDYEMRSLESLLDIL